MRNPLRALFDRRSIGSSHDLWTHMVRGSTSSSGAVVNENSALSVSVVLTCVSLISRTIMTLPIDVLERLDDGGKRQAPRTNPLVRLFDNPNSWQDWPGFVQMLQAHLLLRGNAFAWVNWVIDPKAAGDGLQAKEIWPIHPDQMRVEQKSDFTLVYTLTKKNGAQVVIPQDEILHLRGLSTDGYMGRSPMQDLRESIGSALSMQEHAGNTWSRGGVPDMVLSHPKNLSDKARKGLEESWEQTYGGKSGRRVAVIEEAMVATPLGVKNNDAQFLETAKFTRSELAGAFHVPPHMIGDTDKSTSWGTGIEQQKIGYLTFTIQPWLTVWEHGLRRALIKNESRFYVKFKVEGLLRGDSAARADFYERMWRVGAFSTNDILALEDRDPIGTTGDTRYVPMNYVPLGTPVVNDSSARMDGQLSELLERLRAQGKAA